MRHRSSTATARSFPFHFRRVSAKNHFTNAEGRPSGTVLLSFSVSLTMQVRKGNSVLSRRSSFIVKTKSAVRPRGRGSTNVPSAQESPLIDKSCQPYILLEKNLSDSNIFDLSNLSVSPFCTSSLYLSFLTIDRNNVQDSNISRRKASHPTLTSNSPQPTICTLARSIRLERPLRS